jgi:hypothetical protein
VSCTGQFFETLKKEAVFPAETSRVSPNYTALKAISGQLPVRIVSFIQNKKKIKLSPVTGREGL